MIERTLVLVKPDGVYRALIGKVLSTFEEAGLKVIGLKMVQPDEDMAAKHYIADEEWMKSIGKKAKETYREKGQELKESEIEIGQRVRNNLLKYLTSGPVAAIALEGITQHIGASEVPISVIKKIGGRLIDSMLWCSTIPAFSMYALESSTAALSTIPSISVSGCPMPFLSTYSTSCSLTGFWSSLLIIMFGISPPSLIAHFKCKV